MGLFPTVFAADVIVEGMAGSFRILQASHLSKYLWSTATSPLGPMNMNPQQICCLDDKIDDFFSEIANYQKKYKHEKYDVIIRCSLLLLFPHA